MKIKFVILIMCVCVMGCGLVEDILPQAYHVDPGLRPYFDNFYAEASKRGIFIKKENLIASIVPSNQEVNYFNPGKHERWPSGQRVIYIDAYTFETGEYYHNEIIIFHEIGHWQGVEHCECDENNIMHRAANQYMFDDDDGSLRDKVLDTFFNQIKQNL